MDSDYPKTPGFSERKIPVKEVADWAKKKKFEILHQDKGANVVMVGEDHTDYETFLAEKELIEKTRPNYVIVEALPAGSERENSIWSLADASAVGIDMAPYADKILELANQTLEKLAAESLEERRAEGLLDEGETLDTIKKEYRGMYPYPNNAAELLHLPFYLWPFCIKDGFRQFQLSQRDSAQKRPVDKIAKLIAVMAPRDDVGFGGGDQKLFGIMHSAYKAGSRVVGMDNNEAKKAIIGIIRKANARREEKLAHKVATEADVEVSVEGMSEMYKLMKTIEFTPEELSAISMQAKLRRETMAQSIVEKIQDGSTAIVITGSAHLDSKDENYIPAETAGIKRIAIKRLLQKKATRLGGLSYIDRLTR